jgi:hypothetical protein
VAFGALLVGLGVLAWAAGDGVEGEARARLVRVVGLFSAAGLGVAAPHLLFPDPDLRRLHLANPDGRRLLGHQVWRWTPVLAALVVPPAVLAAGGGWALAAEGALTGCAVGLFALGRALPLGGRIQRWERGEAGAGYRRFRARAEVVSSAPPLAVPDALVPGLLLTAEVFLAGAAVAVAGQTGWGVAAAAALLALAVGLLLRQQAGFDHAFWASNGVWSDAFYTAGAEGGREPLGYAAVYWAPPAVRPTVWAGLVSLDRRLPLGRIAVLGLAVVVAVHVVDVPVSVRAAVLALWVAGVNGASALAVTDAITPGSLAHRLHGAGGWTLARFLINVRWLPPLIVALALLAWLTDITSVPGVLVWTGVYLLAAVASAVLATLVARLQYRRAAA